MLTRSETTICSQTRGLKPRIHGDAGPAHKLSRYLSTTPQIPLTFVVANDKDLPFLHKQVGRANKTLDGAAQLILRKVVVLSSTEMKSCLGEDATLEASYQYTYTNGNTGLHARSKKNNRAIRRAVRKQKIHLAEVNVIDASQELSYVVSRYHTKGSVLVFCAALSATAAGIGIAKDIDGTHLRGGVILLNSRSMHQSSTVLLHELGHHIGLGHRGIGRQVMNSQINLCGNTKLSDAEKAHFTNFATSLSR